MNLIQVLTMKVYDQMAGKKVTIATNKKSKRIAFRRCCIAGCSEQACAMLDDKYYCCSHLPYRNF